MENIPSLEIKHKDSPLHHTFALRHFLIHPGAECQGSDGTRTLFPDTKALDTLITLIRHSQSYGYEVSEHRLSKVEKAIMNPTKKDFGWNAEQDRLLKGTIVKMLLEDGLNIPMTFDDLFRHRELDQLFWHNKNCRLLSGVCVPVELTKFPYSLVEVPKTSKRNIHEIEFNSLDTLQNQIEKQFDIFMIDGHPFHRTLSQHSSRSLCLRYHHDARSTQTIEDLKILTFDAPYLEMQVSGQPERYIGQSYFNLFAVVRTSEGVQMRTYAKDGRESLPGEVGEFRTKDPLDEQGWSIEDGGKFFLFYYREVWTEDMPPTEMGERKKYSERDWARNDLKNGR